MGLPYRVPEVKSSGELTDLDVHTLAMSSLPWALMSVAIVAAMIAMGIKRVRRKARYTIRENGPFTVHSYRDIDRTIDGHACDCGGGWRILGESSRTNGKEIRIVRVECFRCEAESRYLFDLSQIHH